MKTLIYFSILILLLASSCRSVRKTTVDIRHQKDSVAYSSVTTVDLDTTIIPQDSASLNILIGFKENDTTTGTYSGPFGIQEVKQDQGDNISLSYSIEKTPSGSTRVKVKATTKPKEIVTQSTTVETVKYDQSSDIQKVETTKKVSGISMWHLAWVIPLILIGIVIYLKRKTILKFLPF